MDTQQHLKALSLEAEAEAFAAAEGITHLQAIRHLRDRRWIAGQSRRMYRGR